MKHFVKIFVLILTIIGFWSIFMNVNAESSITDKANLIEKYLVSHREDIVTYSTKYKFLNDKDIQNNLAKIDLIIKSLRKVQESTILVDEKIISIILDEIKIVNENLKNLLNLKKAKYDKLLQSQKEAYQDLGEQLSVKIDGLYSAFYPTLNRKKTLTESETKLKSVLEGLNFLSKNVQNFKLKKFDTIEDMQSYFLNSVNNIKYYMLVLKELLK